MYSTSTADLSVVRTELLDLWANNLPVRGPLEDKLNWFYRNGPHGHGRAFVVSSGTRAVGCAGVGSRTLHFRGRPLRVALFADLAIDREHRSGLAAVALLRAIRQHVAADYELGYGFPNARAEAVYRRAGYRELGRITRYVRVLRPSRYLGRVPALGTLADRALATLGDLRAALERDFTLAWADAFDARFDALWEVARSRYPAACERTAAFLTWRFARGPRRIATLLSRRTGELAAYAVVRDGGDDSAEVVDLFGPGERELGALLARIVPAVAALGHTALVVRFLGDPRIDRLLRTHGFFPREPGRTVVIGGERGVQGLELRARELWYLTSLDEDT